MTDNRNIDRVAYDDRLLEVTGLDRAKLPDLVPPGTIIGHARPRRPPPTSGIPAGLPVAVGSGDVHSAVFGSGAVADFDAHLYIGTSSWISGHVPFKKTAPDQQRGLHPRRPGRPVRDRRRARDGRGLPDLPAATTWASPRTSRP